MKITALVTIANSHIVGYMIDNEQFIWLDELKEALTSKTLKLDNVKLNQFNHIEIKDEEILQSIVIGDIFDMELLMYTNSSQVAPAYYENAIFQYDNNGKPIKIDPAFFLDFEYYGDKFKPFLFNNSQPITEMRFLFKNVSQVKIDISNIDTQYVKDMTGMFNYCATHILDLSTLDTSNVTTMRLMFSQCNILKVDLSNFNMVNVMDKSRMFANATIGELILPKISVSNLVQANEIFENAHIGILNLNLLNLSTIDNIKAIIKMLYQCKTTISTIVYKNAHSDIETLLTSNWRNVT